jgi:xylan 1,4-beta-xylosidase
MGKRSSCWRSDPRPLRLFYLLAAATLIYVCAGWLTIAASAQSYSNPVIAGDFPDPSIIRVGEDYYATATSGGWAPIFSIAHSRDLVNWSFVGSVFPKPPKWAKGDFWAPEFSEDQGMFYLFYTARRDEGKGKKGTLCVAVAVSQRPDGPYMDKGPLVCQEMGSLDPFFIRDENGRPFLIWKEDGNDRQQPTWLYAQQLDDSISKLIGKPKKLFRNEGTGWENHVIEGADVIRHGGWYYLFYAGNACCGRSCNYALGVARSKTLLGNWEKNPANPVLAANETWQCPGHGTVVETPNGSDYLLYHAYRRNSAGFNIGREALLDRVDWPRRDGWPTINDGRGASKNAKVPFTWANQQKDALFSDEFDGSILGPVYQVPASSPPVAIDLQNSSLGMAESDRGEALVAIRTASGNYEASTHLITAGTGGDEIASLSAYSWRQNAVGISVSKGKVSAWRRENGKQAVAASAEVSTDHDVYLRMAAREAEFFQFAYSTDGKVWIYLGKPVLGSHLEGTRVALMHAGEGRSIRFDWLRITAG